MSSTWTAILLAGAGTFLMRASFLLAAHRLTEVPDSVQRVLRQIPPAALAALVVPALLRPDGDLDLWQPQLAAGLLAGLVCWRTKSVALTLVVGMTTLACSTALRQAGLGAGRDQKRLWPRAVRQAGTAAGPPRPGIHQATVSGR